MSEECTHDCSTCSAACSSREQSRESFIEKTNPQSSIKKVIGVVSGKGGVGKSLVTSLLGVLLRRQEYNVGILDADITGPSIAKIFGIHEKAQANEWGILPARSANDIEIMSVNMLLEDESAPVVWRGPIIAGAVKQFWTDVVWGELDFLLVDMPPGTGDVPLTVFQSLPVDGIVIVTSPQELVSDVVEKAVNMAKMMEIPILGLVENMSWLSCPDCGKKISVFGESRAEEQAARFGIDLLAQIPIEPKLTAAADAGKMPLADAYWLDKAAEKIESLLK